MPAHELDAVFYVARVPSIAYGEGAFHVAYEVGKCRFEFAMPPSVFLKALRDANKASDAFHEGRGQVVQLGKRA